MGKNKYYFEIDGEKVLELTPTEVPQTPQRQHDHGDYDIAIIGAGPAGLTAALYAARANKRVILFDKDIPGGQLNHATHIENFPGFNHPDDSNAGIDLIHEMTAQLSAYENLIDTQLFTPIFRINVASPTTTTKYPYKILTEDGETYRSRGLIIATGLTHRHILPCHSIEEELTNVGVISHCVLCDGPFDKGHTSAIIGDGNSALQAFIKLAEINRDEPYGGITLFSNAPDFPPYADAALVSKVKEILVDNGTNYRCSTRAIFNFKTIDIGQTSASNFVSGYVSPEPFAAIRYDFTGHIFVMIGQEPTDIIKKIYPATFRATATSSSSSDGYLTTDATTCKIPGLPNAYAAGDCRASRPVRQAITAASEGAIAATHLCSALDAEGK